MSRKTHPKGAFTAEEWKDLYRYAMAGVIIGTLVRATLYGDLPFFAESWFN